MKRLFKFAALAFFILAVSLVAVGTESARAQPGRIAYRVDLSNPASGTVGVTLEVEASPQPLMLEIQDTYGDGLAVDLASHIIDESAVDSTGKALPMNREGNTWRIDGAGNITISYKVDLSGYKAGTDYLNSLAGSGPPWPYFPYLDASLAYLPGYAVFVHPNTPEELKPQVELLLPPGWQQALVWTEQPGSLGELLSNPLFAGELILQEQGSLRLALPSASAAASGVGLPEYAGKIQTLLLETENLLGGLELSQDKRLLVALLFRGEGDQIVDQYYPSGPFSSSISLPGPSRNDLLSDSTIEATARGLVALILANEINIDREALWLTEGTSWYFQDLVPYLAGIWGARTFWDRFDRHYNAYREVRGRFPGSLADSGFLASVDADAAAVLNCGGASACATLDSDLKDIEPFGGDLAALLRSLAGLKDKEAPLGNDAILSTLEGMTGRSWSAFFNDYIQGTGEIPASSFSSLNVARPEENTPPVESPKTSTAGWITLVVAIFIVFLVPFILEPYTMRPRKPGFLEKELGKDEDE